MNLDGITALVTGGASGLGLASARRLIREGGNVVIMDLPSSRGKDVSEELGGKTSFAPGDETSPDDLAVAVAAADEIDGERGVCVLTASIAGFEGQIGQIAYSASKGGVVGMTLVAARDLASSRIRVCSIAPGIMDTPMLGNLLRADLKASLSATVPNPPRLGNVDEFADLAAAIVRNAYLNGETIRLDGALRMAPR